ncbi:MAG: hypothetical protein ABW032_05160 [Burkholderiaceae bacterium]
MRSPVTIESRSEVPPHAAAGSAGFDRDAIRVLNLREIEPVRLDGVMRQLTTMLHATWKHCTEEFADFAAAEEAVRARMRRPDETVFVAFDEDDAVIGTGSVGGDDFYDGLSRENGVEPGYVGRDLVTAAP